MCIGMLVVVVIAPEYGIDIVFVFSNVLDIVTCIVICCVIGRASVIVTSLV